MLNMKKCLFTTLLMLIVSFSFISCNKNNGNTNPQEDEYYVRYEVEDDYYTSYGYTTHISVNTEYGYQDFNVERTFNETFGPVNKNFVAHIKVHTTPSDYHTKEVSIYVCKNEAPFALKAYKKINNSIVDLSYQIDF